MADKPKTPAEFKAAAAARQQPARRKKAPYDPNAPVVKIDGTKSNDAPQTPLNWIMDMVTRPLSGVTNAEVQGMDRGIRANQKWNSGDVVGSLAERFNPLNPIGDFVEGLTTTDTKKHLTNSQVIERATDTFGKLSDPNYKDVKDNVNPWVKGIGGFVGDVAVDPLSYIPGAAFLTAGRGIATGAKVLTAGVKGGEVAAKAAIDGSRVANAARKVTVAEKAATKAADKAAKKAERVNGKIPTPTPAGAVAADTAKVVEEAATATEAQAVGLPAKVPTVTEALLAKYTPEELSKFRDSAPMADARAQLGEFTASTKGIRVEPAIAAQVAKVSAADAKRFDDNWIMQADDLLADTPFAQQPKVKIDGKDVPFSMAAGAALKREPKAIAALQEFHGRVYGQAFRAGMSAGHHVNALGKAIDPIQAGQAAAKVSHDTQLAADLADAVAHRDQLLNDPAYAQSVLDDAQSTAIAAKSTDVPTAEMLLRDAEQEVQTTQQMIKASTEGADTVVMQMASAREVFLAKQAENRALVEQRLGKPLLDYLNAHAYNDQRFDKTMSNLRNAIDSGLDFSTMKALDKPLERLLRGIGMDTSRIPLKAVKIRDVAAKVPPPKNIAEFAAKYEKDPEIVINIASRALGTGAARDIVDVLKTHPYRSASGALKTDKAYAEGVSNIRQEMGTHNQATFFNSIIKSASKESTGRAGADSATFKQAIGMPALRLVERALDERGVPMVLGVPKVLIDNGVAEEGRVLLGVSQYLDILDEANHEIVLKTVFNQKSSVAPTNLSDAIHAAVTGTDPVATRALVEEMLRQSETAYTKGIPNAVKIPNPILSKFPMPYGRAKLNSDALIAELADTIVRVAPTLRRQVADNATSFEKRVISETMLMTDEHLQVIEDAFSNGTLGDWVTAVSESGARLKGDASEYGFTQQATEQAAIAVDAAIPPVDKAVADAIVNNAAAHVNLEVKAGKSAEAAYAVSQAANKTKAAADGQRIIEESLATDAADVSRDLGDNILGSADRSFSYRLLGKVNRAAATGQFHGPMRTAEGIFRDIVGRNVDSLNQLNRLWSGPGIDSKALWTEAMRAIQTGAAPATPLVAEHLSKLEELTAQMFGRMSGAKNADQLSMMNNQFFAGNAALPHVNAVFDKYKLGSTIKPADGMSFTGFNLEEAAANATKSGRSIMAEVADQWRSWEIHDPATFVNIAYTSLAKITADQTVAATLLKVLRDTPGSSSKVAKAGFERVSNDSGKSILAAYIPDNVYIRSDILDQVHAVDNYMQQSLNLGDNVISHFIKNVYRPIQDMWKMGMTIPNPTHHIRNSVSDGSLTVLAEGAVATDLRLAKDAFHVMAVRGGYSNWDAIAALQGIHEVPNVGKVVAKTRHGEVRADQIHREMADRGLLPNFRTIENLDDNAGEATGKLAAFWRKTQSTKPVKFMGGASEARDHYFRMHHVLVILKKEANNPKFKTQTELFDYAAERVRKWHPDGSDLTGTEQAFKLLIPFYSWQRKTIPLIAEALMTNPARVSAIPKAQFAIATGMGVDPASLADPFPTDQMFPSYLSNQSMSGPIAKIDNKYWGVSPGFAANDILNDYAGANPLLTVMQSGSPLLRAPFEMSAQAKVGGARVNDMSDYIDSSLPGVSVLARLTGYSPTGSAVSLAQGKGLDKQYQIQRGNRDQAEATRTGALNWILGAGIQNMSTKNAINYAEIEKRNRAKLASSGGTGF